MEHNSTAFDQTIEHFRTRGFMRVPGAFSSQEAEAMRAAVWRMLEKSNIRESEPSTWLTERPTRLQELKHEPVFGAAWGPRTRAAIGQILETASSPGPRSWGGFSFLLAGLHTLLHRWFKKHPPRPGARVSDHRKSLMNHPYIRDLHKKASADQRVARFMLRTEQHDGIEFQVVENIGAAGDVFLVHPLLLHAASVNAGRAPRFLLSGAIDLDSMWAT